MSRLWLALLLLCGAVFGAVATVLAQRAAGSADMDTALMGTD